VIVTVQEAGRALGIAKGAAGRLAACGLLGEVTMRGNRRTVSAAAVLDLQNRPSVELPAPPALVVRVGEPTRVQDRWRSWIGWSASWSPAIQKDAVRGDWVIDPDAVMRTGRLVVLVAGFVVAAYAVTGRELQYWDEPTNRHRARFLVGDDEDTATPFTNRRWQLPPGWAVSIIAAQKLREARFAHDSGSAAVVNRHMQSQRMIALARLRQVLVAVSGRIPMTVSSRFRVIKVEVIATAGVGCFRAGSKDARAAATPIPGGEDGTPLQQRVPLGRGASR
jgi:hypothetical protein